VNPYSLSCQLTYKRSTLRSGAAGRHLLLVLIFLIILFSLPSHAVPLYGKCGSTPLFSMLEKIPEIAYHVDAVFHHDPEAFTQGLAWGQGMLYESTGLYGASSIRLVEPHTGNVLRMKRLPASSFGEGLAFTDGRLIQLTWKEETAYVYDGDSFSIVNKIRYAGEGWGLADGNGKIFMSNGGPYLSIRDPGAFREEQKVQVHAGATPISNINELEYADGVLFANVWKENLILRIDPQSGKVTGFIDLDKLPWPTQRDCQDREKVANGIAYDPQKHFFYITGKRWPYLFRLSLIHH
jgi:glutamine cyclotransferase